MLQNSTIDTIQGFLKQHSDKEAVLKDLGNQLTAQQSKLDRCIEEQQITAKALQALQDVRPILAAVSSEQSIALANQALEHVFLTDDKLFFSEEESRFYISTPEGDTDLVAANGGGYLAVISFIFTLFLLIKQKSRRWLLYDEQFTMLSDDALERFIPFLRDLCKDLQLEMILITHDARIQLSDVDSCYFLSDGTVKKIK